ncbi:MAG: glycine cleavage system aminomethyltransferase GcvT [Actinomycetota bacterium]
MKSPLYEEHRRLGARMIDFAGWEMPLAYPSRGGVVAEHRAARERLGIFDVSHLGKIVVEGPGAAAILEGLLPGPVSLLAPWSAGYNLLLNERAGIVDDLFVYHRPDYLVVVPNAANTPAVLGAIRQSAGGEARVTDAGERWAILAVQGPRSRELAEALMPAANRLPLHAFADLELVGTPIQVARTGYTGEYGFELFAPWNGAETIWRRLLEMGEPLGGMPAGLGARDTLRLEMGYPLHGHEISPETNPLEAGLAWVIDWEKPRFRGKARLERIKEAGVSRRLTGLVAEEPGIPRRGHAILSRGTVVGEVTSGNFSPVLGRGIALGYVPPDLASPGTMLAVDVRGRALAVRVTKPPFIRPSIRPSPGRVSAGSR